MPLSCEFGVRNHGSVELPVEAVIERVWDTLGGDYQAILEEYMEAVNLEVVVREGGATGPENLFIG